MSCVGRRVVLGKRAQLTTGRGDPQRQLTHTRDHPGIAFGFEKGVVGGGVLVDERQQLR